VSLIWKQGSYPNCLPKEEEERVVLTGRVHIDKVELRGRERILKK